MLNIAQKLRPCSSLCKLKKSPPKDSYSSHQILFVHFAYISVVLPKKHQVELSKCSSLKRQKKYVKRYILFPLRAENLHITLQRLPFSNYPVRNLNTFQR